MKAGHPYRNRTNKFPFKREPHPDQQVAKERVAPETVDFFTDLLLAATTVMKVVHTGEEAAWKVANFEGKKLGAKFKRILRKEIASIRAESGHE